jgi:outer membrane immunogenic protein
LIASAIIIQSYALSGASFLALTAVSALAADFPVGPVEFAPPPIARLYNWTGFYGGANVGYSWGRGSADILDPIAGGMAVSVSERPSGALGGVQLGANWQTGNGVFGFEADIQGAGQSSSATASGFLTVVNPDGTLGLAPVAASDHTKLSSFATLRGRVGMAADRWLFYLTGGAVWGTFSSDVALTGAGTASISKTRDGSALGLGVEVAILENWTIKAEYLRLQFRTSASPLPAAPGLSASSRIEDSIFRVGFNYLFRTGSLGCRPHDC